jgi:hypothetical protein
MWSGRDQHYDKKLKSLVFSLNWNLLRDAGHPGHHIYGFPQDGWSILPALRRATEGPRMARIGRALKRPWVIPLYVITIGFLAFRLPSYIGLDPSKSSAVIPANEPVYYPMLVTHIFFGSVAMVTAAMQIWPWLHRRWPKVHRWAGRVYVFAGVLPAGLAILSITPLLPHGATQRVGYAMLALLWLGTTFVGYRRVRQQRYVEHREWMIRSFSLCFAILASRFWLGPVILLLEPQVFAGIEGSPAVQDQVSGVVTWVSWVTNLLIAEWWINRSRYKKLGEQAAKRNAAVSAAVAEAQTIAARVVQSPDLVS